MTTQMTLGRLTHICTEILRDDENADKPVYFDFCRLFPLEVSTSNDSTNLSIGYSNAEDAEPTTLSDFLRFLNGTKLDLSCSERKLWVGDADDAVTAITGVYLLGNVVVLETGMLV